jgi:hypothetical protein
MYLNSLDLGDAKNAMYWGTKYYKLLRITGITDTDTRNIKNDIAAKCK